MGNDMEKIAQMLMAMLGNNSSEEQLKEVSDEPEETEETFNEISEDILHAQESDDNGLANLLGGFTGEKDKRVSLLSSIKPYMNGKRQEKVDMAINFVRLMSVSSSLGFNFFDWR